MTSTENNQLERPHTTGDTIAMPKINNKHEFESKEFTDDDVDIDQFYEDHQAQKIIAPPTGTTETVNETVKDSEAETVTADDGFTAIEREDATVSV